MERPYGGIFVMISERIPLTPQLSPSELRGFVQFFRKVCRAISRASEDEISELIRKFREELQSGTATLMSNGNLEGAFAKSVLLDLLGAGWKIRVVAGKVEIAPPCENAKDPSELKAAVRRSHQFEREDQLTQPSVRDFVRGMERRQLTTKGWHSIYSLMRDGSELAYSLRKILWSTRPEENRDQLDALSDVIDPYIQLVTENGICEQTGLLLQDIWRYFRLTWVNSYKQLPGRTMSLLIRDAAAKNHPVIGIAALGSSVAQQRLRDIWVGWDQETMVATIRNNPSGHFGQWLKESLNHLIEGIYLEDLIADHICTRWDLKNPTDACIKKLEQEGERAIKLHRLYPQAAAHKKSNNNGWKTEAQTYLYRSKRSKTFAKLLRIQAIFQRCGFNGNSKGDLAAAMEKADMRNAVGQLVRMVKAQHVGIDMMDITVCGAVAPYNVLLGGKLVCMLLCSPEVIAMYRKRYGRQVSVIASSMKGRAVVRRPQLVLLATTSLFGVGSSQYNRVRIPCDRIGGRQGEQIVYQELGTSEGYGTYHLGDMTTKLGNTLLARQKGGRRVNSIFGEGVNPRMRKLREAFEKVGLPPDEILQHRNTRVVYGVKLARNFSDVLLGLTTKANYLFPLSIPQKRTKQIAAYWRERWLHGRIERPGMLDDVARHTLAYPVTHGGRVILPPSDSNQNEFEFV
jgi:hypothetical protein